jgi:hypothetical protein
MPDPIKPTPYFGHLNRDELAHEQAAAKRSQEHYAYLATTYAERLAHLEAEIAKRDGAKTAARVTRPDIDAAFVPPEEK